MMLVNQLITILKYAGGCKMTELSEFITTVGFPIFVAVYMLWKTSEDSATLNETVNKLTIAVTELTTLIKEGNINE